MEELHPVPEEEPLFTCPDCGNNRRFVLSVDAAASVDGDEVEASAEYSDWYEDSRVICSACNRVGTVTEFDGEPTRYRPRYRVTLTPCPGGEAFTHETTSITAAVEIGMALTDYETSRGRATMAGYGPTTTIERLSGDDWMLLGPHEITQRLIEGD